MREVPSCLNRRYEALDKLINELNEQHMGCYDSRECTHDPEIQLMCKFWSILKEDPDCDLPQAIQHRLCMQKSESGSMFAHQRISCYMATEDNSSKDPAKEDTPACAHGSKPAEATSDQKNTTTATNEPVMKCCTSREAATPPPAPPKDDIPLSKVLCNLKEAASFDKRCHVRMNNLIESEKMLQEQIKILEGKEKQGVEMLQQADCIWSCMEESYKQKIQESLERQKFLLTQLKDVEKSTSKWRKNKKDLESQLQTLSKCQEEIKDKINQKTIDMKTMNKEIEDFKKRIEADKKDSEASKNSLAGKKKASDERLARIGDQIKKLQEELEKEQGYRADKENEGNVYIREAREDLQNICKLLLLKKLEHEDLLAEKNALILEINLLKDSCGQCKDRCKNKQSSLDDELIRLDQEIEKNRIKCLRCHACSDTADVRKYCGDCPRCQGERDCIYNEDHCVHDESMDCVCQIVKRKFLDNVFDNMYTVLERKAKTGPGKAVAEAVMDCLRRSRNGKLNPETRKILQEFILSTVKKNLNLTIVGGAVKTRCEMEPEMYEKLMLCLKGIVPTKAPKTDAATDVKKEPCKRWGGPRECHCNKGPNACICTKKAPPPIKEPGPGPCPLNKDDEEDRCPIHKDHLCGPECSTRAKGRGPCGGIPDPADLGDLSQYMAPPCQGPSCPYSKDMRAARCVFGSEPLSSTQSFKTAVSSFDPVIDSNAIMCKCEGVPAKPCTCQDVRSHPRQRIIEEVLGRYDVMPIEKVSELDGNWSTNIMKGGKIIEGCSLSTKRSMNHSSSFNKYPQMKDAEKQSSSKQLPSTIASHLSKQSTGDKINNICNKQDRGLVSNNKTINASNASKGDHEINPVFDELSSSWNTLITDECTRDVADIRKMEKIDLKTLEQRICERVSELIKNSIVTKETNNNSKTSLNIEWISVDSLINRITLACESSDNSNVTQNEVEVKNEALDYEGEIRQKYRSPNLVAGTKTYVQNSDLKNKKNNHGPTGGVNNMLKSSSWKIKNIEKAGKFLKAPKSSITDMYFDNLEVKLSKLYNVYENLKEIKQNLQNNDISQIKTIENIEKEIKDLDLTFERLLAMKENSRRDMLNKEVEADCLATSANPKQLKAILDKNPSFKSCWNEWDDYLPIGNQTKKPHSPHHTVKEDSLQVKLKKVPSVLTDVISKSQQQHEVGTEPLVEYKDKKKAKDHKNSLNKKGSKEQFQGYLTEVKSTYSGDLFLELDDKTISKIKERAKDSCHLHIPIKETDSGNYLLDFDSDENTSNDSKKVILQKSCSGAMFLEVDKDIVNNLHPYLRTSHSKPSVSIVIVKKKVSCDCTEEQQIRRRTTSITHFMQKLGQYERVESKTEQKINSTVNSPTLDNAKTTIKYNSSTALLKRCKSIDDYRAELIRYNIGSERPLITIKVQGENGVVGNTQAEVIETPSGNIALCVKKEDLSHIGHIAARCEELPVLLKRISGTYTLYLQKQLKTKAPNTVLRRTASGNFLIVITEPVISLVHRRQLSEYTVKEKMFKINVKGTKDDSKLIEPPALLKLTPSENYVLVLNKEFEKEHKSCFDQFEDQSFVELRKTDSDTVLISFDEGDSIHNKQNALLVRSDSGGMKILVNGPVFDTLSLLNSKRPSAAQAIEEILLRRKSNTHSDTKNHEVRLVGVKSSSDSTLYAQLKHQTRNMNLNTASLKRTDSGKYAILLHKNDKKNFINNLKSYLSTKNHGLVPILKGNKSEEITIDLSRHKNDNDQCGSLKITPSGNIFITVDEKFVSTVSNYTENRETQYTTDFGQYYVINDKLDFSPKRRSPVKDYKSDVKSSSHCDLYEKAKSRLQNQTGLLDGSSATVKKTGSGHFLVILNKESKKALINDVRSCLNNQSQDRIQFWRGTESGGITIDLSGMKNNRDNCGSLKITNSGNIYVIVDEKQLKNITKDIESNNYALSSVADVVLKNVFPPPRKTSFAEPEPEKQNLSNTAKDFQNKNTATHCKGKPDDITCDRSKCVCFAGENIDSEYDEGTSSYYKYSKTAPHIVIKPCGCQKPNQKYMSHEQCFYVMDSDSVCPVHKDRYETVSNEILEISGKCIKTKRSNKKVNKPKRRAKVNIEERRLDWDALSYLPPQLPPFLRNFQRTKYTK